MVKNEKVRSKAVREVVVYTGLFASQKMCHGGVLWVSWLCVGRLRKSCLSWMLGSGNRTR
jgi:hypothetical protein